MARPPFWRDVRNLAWIFQLAVLGIVVGIIVVLFNNVRVNSASQGIPTDFGFLDQPAGFEIPANDLRSTQPVRDAVVQGALNTLRVAVTGIVLATVLGVAVGIGRLSGNWLVRNLTRLYVEAIRNVPLLGLVIFAYLALVLAALPRLEDTWDWGFIVINVRGVSVPWLSGPLLWVLVSAAVAAIVVRQIRKRLPAALDGSRRRGPITGARLVVTLAVIVFAIATLSPTNPDFDGRIVTGGITMQPEYFALLVALVIYTASHIAEIVRGSIQAVPRGQVEASSALALNGWQRLRHVVLPQAFQIATPPLGNQYLNLLKNSSLGFVISYFELTKVMSTSIGNRSPAVPAYVLLMAIYLALSLAVSAAINYFNRRQQVEYR